MKYTHEPVLLEEILEFFRGQKLKTFFEGTIGFAGHAQAILKEHPEIERYIGFDQDPQSIAQSQENLGEYKAKIELVRSNFENLDGYFEKHKISCADGFFFDIGVCSSHLDDPTRGFSFMREGPLDMRMNTEDVLTAEKVVNEYPEKKLGEILKELGEEPKWRRIARAIIKARSKKRIKTTLELAKIISEELRTRGRLHPATLSFQALRIFVNRELEVLQSGIMQALQRMCPGARMGVISFHSLEDRIVKNLFRDFSKKGGRFNLLTKKPITETRGKVRKNPRARSAKLRFIECIHITAQESGFEP